MKYTFIHPTKTGGTACENYFKQYYHEYITGSGHVNVCTNLNKPIIVIREPVNRFISMYKYWLNGAIDTRYKRPTEFIEKYKNYDIKHFISLIKNNKKEDLYNKFTWDQHFHPITNWILDTEYSNIIIVKYDKTLNEKINKLITMLDIPNKHIDLPIVNISKNIDEPIHLDDSDMEFIREHFKLDYELLEQINNQPELFKIVI
jgi:hypothetical protein